MSNNNDIVASLFPHIIREKYIIYLPDELREKISEILLIVPYVMELGALDYKFIDYNKIEVKNEPCILFFRSKSGEYYSVFLIRNGRLLIPLPVNRTFYVPKSVKKVSWEEIEDYKKILERYQHGE